MNLPENQRNKKFDFNYYITKFFLGNTRLTILSLVFFMLVGVFATLALKTTGFPSPEIGVSFVQTTYPGATAQVVADEVTIPLEGAVKNVDGVKRFSSSTQNSFSQIVVEFNEGVDLDIVRNRLSTALNSVTLPSGATTPKVNSPSISGPDMLVAVSAQSNDEIYTLKSALLQKLSAESIVSEAEELHPLEKRVEITLNTDKAVQNGVDIATIQAVVATFGETLPVTSNSAIDGKNTSIVTSLTKNTLEDLQALTIPSVQTGQLVKLTDVATVNVVYGYTNNQITWYSFGRDMRNDGDDEQNTSRETFVIPSTLIQIKAVDGSDQNELLTVVKSAADDISDTVEVLDKDSLISSYTKDTPSITVAYTTAEDNNRQVSEVIAGLIGGPIDELGAFKYLGYILGGIWLVMIVMIAIVSWRAAIIAALSIPLSFIFSTFFLYITGESLNTLTLFSLVLVTGLVVDPTLVVLEAIQRKLDAGHKASEAVLEAISDVGMGVFLAMLTNIIVFAPFGVLSGIFGQIFRYIPYTIVPAVIGSYLVPIVVLSWLGSKFLKRNSHATGTEEENLWGIAHWLIALNARILRSHPSIRFGIIAGFLILPLVISGVLYANGSIKVVQFAQSDDVRFLTMSGNFLSTIPQDKQNEAAQAVLQTVVQVEEVTSVVPISQGFDYVINLTDKNNRERTSRDISSELSNALSSQFGRGADQSMRVFSDITVLEAQTGGQQDYQTSIAIESENPEVLKRAAQDVGNIIETKACVKDEKEVVFDENCAAENVLIDFIDDGYSLNTNTVLDIQYSREALLANRLGVLGRGPLLGGVNSQLTSQFSINQSKPVTTIQIDGQDTDVLLKPENAINSMQALDEKVALTGGTIVQTEPAQTIQRQSGKTTALVQIRFKEKFANNQAFVQQVNDLVTQYYTENNNERSRALGLEPNTVGAFANGQSADAARAFTQLGIALLLAIVLSYIVLAVFFNSFLQPLSILYTIPITFIGVFPALAYFVGGQFGFLEIIGLIILIGIVENVAIFLIDGANQQVREQGWDKKRAISYMSGVRFKPVLMTSVTTFASLLPLAIFSDFYRSISTVVLSGLLVSGFISLITTPILYIFFDWVSHKYRAAGMIHKFLFWLFVPIYLIVWSLQKKSLSK